FDSHSRVGVLILHATMATHKKCFHVACVLVPHIFASARYFFRAIRPRPHLPGRQVMAYNSLAQPWYHSQSAGCLASNSTVLTIDSMQRQCGPPPPRKTDICRNSNATNALRREVDPRSKTQTTLLHVDQRPISMSLVQIPRKLSSRTCPPTTKTPFAIKLQYNTPEQLRSVDFSSHHQKRRVLFLKRS
ncbi:unnamed protein product, partial [Ectocarpus fasciculatus]